MNPVERVQREVADLFYAWRCSAQCDEDGGCGQCEPTMLAMRCLNCHGQAYGLRAECPTCGAHGMRKI